MPTMLKDRASVEKIIQEMSVAEKAQTVIGGSLFRSQPMPKYGIPALTMIDSCNGMNSLENSGEMMYQKLAAAGQVPDREQNGFMGGLVVALNALKKYAMQMAQSGVKPARKEIGCYPPGICYGATWNPEVVEESSRAMAKELAARGADMVLGPNINIHRDPLCGRLAESISEDPCLASGIAVAQVKGIQAEGMIACAKHFAANNQEKDRLGVSEHVPERALREIYLPAFKACVDAGCKSIMSAYNQLNGKPSAMNDDLLTGILRGEWGFDGFVVSDWGASYQQIAAIAAGTDLTMPGPRGIRCVEEAVENGTLPLEKLDACVRNFLNVLVISTAMGTRRTEFSMDESREKAEAAAREGMILLQNDGTLPLAPDTDVVFYGKRSRKFTSCPEGSSKVETDLNTCPYDRAVELLGESHVTFETPTKQTRVWICVVGADGHEGSDRDCLAIDADEQVLMEKAINEAQAAGGKVIVALNATGPVDMTSYTARVNAILCPFFAGMMGGKAVTDAIFGLYNPSGKLPLTWPMRECDCPAYKNYPGENKEVWYGEGMYVGYRWYDARKIAPAYPFGFGLSYTTFEITHVKTPEKVNLDKENVPVQVTIRNTGARSGSEVIQVYVHDVVSKIDKPEKQLRTFRKVHLQPGEEQTVTLTLTKEDFAGYSLSLREFVTEPGTFELLVGTSARDLPFVCRVDAQCRNPFGLNGKTGIGKIAKHDRAVEIINTAIHADIRLLAHVAIEFGPDTPFESIWFGDAVGGELTGQGKSKEEIHALYEQVLDAFEQENLQ